MKSKSSYALRMAHALQRNAHLQKPLSSKQMPQNWSDRLRLAWYFVHFRELLKTAVVTFSYWKKDGSLREAKGTLCDILIPEEDKPKGSPTYEPNFSSVPYYDLDKKDWRAFRITDFVGFVSVYELSEISNEKKTEKRTKKE